jgi:membrane associated rhomboid family serine protease
MKSNTLMAAAIALSFTAATPAFAQSAGKLAKGALIGGAGGAVAGAIIPGLGTGEGALIGAAGGAAITALNHKDRRYYRDGYGRKYWTDKRGRRHYK